MHVHVDGRIVVNVNGLWIRLNNKKHSGRGHQRAVIDTCYTQPQFAQNTDRGGILPALLPSAQAGAQLSHTNSNAQGEKKKKIIARAATSSFFSTFSCLEPVSKGLITSQQ